MARATRKKKAKASRSKVKRSSASSRVTPKRLMEIAWGYAPVMIIEAATRHKLFDTMDAGPKTADQIAQETGTSARGARMTCNALTSFGLLKKDRQGKYALTPESATFLVSTKPSYHGGFFRTAAQRMIPTWLHLAESIRSGGPTMAVNQQTQGADFFHELVSDIFPMSYAAAQALGDAMKIAKLKTPYSVLDLAAGSGVWGIAMAQKSPHVRVTAVDWGKVIPVTKEFTQRFGVADRFTYVEGDMNEANFGAGHQLATLGHILHSEGEQRSRKLLRRTFESLAPGGTIAIAEFVTNKDKTGPANATIFALNMLVHTDHGDTFSFKEIGDWLKEAGFKRVRSLNAPAPSPLILGTKPG